MKEHRLSPMREEQLSAPASEEGSHNVGAGAAGGCPPGSVGGAGSNKKPRSRTKVQYVIRLSPSRTIIRTDTVIVMHFGSVGFNSHSPSLNLVVCILDFPGGLGYPAELHPGCWPVPRPGGHPHLVSTA